MQSDEIKRRIQAFPMWHYQFDLQGNFTPGRRSQRHAWRRHYFFDPLVQLCGGSLAGKRVLDLACNAGFWSLCALEHGCDFVMGIDGRQMHVDQANFVFEVKEIDKSKYDFVLGNIFDMDLEQFGSFDIVLCLGLIYHVNKHMELIEQMSRVNKDILLIDTNLSRAPGSYLEIHHERVDIPTQALDYELVMLPTKLGMVDMVKQFGYSAAILKPHIQDKAELSDYRLGFRRAFLCAKDTNLAHVSARVEHINLRTLAFVEAPMWLAHKLLIRTVRKFFPWHRQRPQLSNYMAAPEVPVQRDA